MLLNSESQSAFWSWYCHISIRSEPEKNADSQIPPNHWHSISGAQKYALTRASGDSYASSSLTNATLET